MLPVTSRRREGLPHAHANAPPSVSSFPSPRAGGKRNAPWHSLLCWRSLALVCMALALVCMTLLTFSRLTTTSARTASHAALPSALAPMTMPTPMPVLTPTPRPLSLKERRQRKRTTALAKALLDIAIESIDAHDPAFARGIVLPLFDEIALLGASLLLELRALHVTAPIEVPHCGDLSSEMAHHLQERDPLRLVRVYDLCAQAATLTMKVEDSSSRRALFCRDLAHCHQRFRGFDIKVLALVLSRFDEVMLLDADTLFFSPPTALWQHSTQYQATGTLFFHDRVSCDHEFLAQPRAHNRTHLQEYLAGFDVAPFAFIASQPRAFTPPSEANRNGDTNMSMNASHIALGFAPSAFLLQSHSWNARAGHQADSSLLLWHKSRQWRATVVLASFLALEDTGGAPGRPPSYGDKELYFQACELAEAGYAFSDYGVGAAGSDARDPTAQANEDIASATVLCGDALQFYPDGRVPSPQNPDPSDPPPLYLNSDHLVSWAPDLVLLRTHARPAALYPGKVEARGLPQECPFDVRISTFSRDQRAQIQQRRRLHDQVAAWSNPEDS